MIWATADLHGTSLHSFRALLDKAGFGDGDFLFVLGDVIDRNGDGGVKLLRWMTLQPNVELLLGNHEAMLLACEFLFAEITDETLGELSPERMGVLSNWLANGAEPTLRALQELHREEPEALADLLNYLRDAPLYETVSAGGRDFVLTHAGLGGFRPDKRLREYTPDELLWHRPRADERYFDDVLTVFGHTPTRFYGCEGHAFRTETWIDIDVGAPMLLRLDDLREYYAD